MCFKFNYSLQHVIGHDNRSIHLNLTRMHAYAYYDIKTMCAFRLTNSICFFVPFLYICWCWFFILFFTSISHRNNNHLKCTIMFTCFLFYFSTFAIVYFAIENVAMNLFCSFIHIRIQINSYSHMDGTTTMPIGYIFHVYLSTSIEYIDCVLMKHIFQVYTLIQSIQQKRDARREM